MPVASTDGGPKPTAFFAETRNVYSASAAKATYFDAWRPGAAPSRTVSTWIDVRFAGVSSVSGLKRRGSSWGMPRSAWFAPQKVTV